MLVLAIDTATQQGSVAVARDEALLELATNLEREDFSAKLFRQIDEILVKSRLTIRDFDLYAVAAGPGTFTGLRVGLSAVKGWAEVFGKPIAAVGALEALASCASEGDKWIAPVLDARRGQVFAGLYKQTSAGLEARDDDCVIELPQFLEFIARRNGLHHVTFITPVPELLRRGLSEFAKGRPERSAIEAATVEVGPPYLAHAVAKLGLVRARQGKLVDALKLEAHYVRRSDAELNWKAPF
jgi:tRNA threonylcarbamoyladenosine biosynthesis protein TsaB